MPQITPSNKTSLRNLSNQTQKAT